MPHSDACRARITSELSQTASGRMRIDKMNERTDEFLAEHLRKQAEDVPAPAQGRDEGDVLEQTGP